MSSSAAGGCFAGRFAGRRVLVTGHTGFKGAWLARWLTSLGAKVTGFALPPTAEQPLFGELDLARRVRHREGDLADRASVQAAVAASNPEIVFHLAAQALVRRSYAEPALTFATNVLGTVHLLDALRERASPCTVVIVTSDKCYENREWSRPYGEDDPLGGHDPYSASKACAEIVTSAYRRSFFAHSADDFARSADGSARSADGSARSAGGSAPSAGGSAPSADTSAQSVGSSARGAAIAVASARAGNVIGGGDWALDRIVPDCVRHLSRGEPVPVRDKRATRPWQHVLEPLSGYLWLAAELDHARSSDPARASDLSTAFNFGPRADAEHTVEELMTAVLEHWPGEWIDRSSPNQPHEAGRLRLDTQKAERLLGWRAVWSFPDTVARTMTWYRETADGARGVQAKVTDRQIAEYVERARADGLAWAR